MLYGVVYVTEAHTNTGVWSVWCMVYGPVWIEAQYRPEKRGVWL